jgi:hypothetical protein
MNYAQVGMRANCQPEAVRRHKFDTSYESGHAAIWHASLISAYLQKTIKDFKNMTQTQISLTDMLRRCRLHPTGHLAAGLHITK